MTRRSVATNGDASASANWHPLFPPEPGEDPGEWEPIAFVTVRRFTSAGLAFLGTHPAATLQSEEDVRSQYGGGSYQLSARSASPIGTPWRNVRQTRVNLPGPSLEVAEDRIGQPAAASPVAHAGAGGTGETAVLLAILQMVQQQASQQQQMMMGLCKMMSEHSASAVAGAKQDAHTFVEMMSRMATAEKDTMRAFLGQVSAQKGSAIDDVRKVLQLVAELTPDQAAGGADTAGAFVEGIKVADQAVTKLLELSKTKPGQGPALEVPPDGAGHAA